MTKNAVSSLWGDFEELEQGEEISTTETKPKEKVTEEEEDNEEVENLPPDSQGGEKEVAPEKAESVKKTNAATDDDVVSTFDAIAESLEVEDLLFIDDDKTYEPTIEGFKEMIKDNIIAHKNKLSKEFLEKEKEIRAEYEKSTTKSVMDLDPHNEDDAKTMLLQYYKEIGLEQNEIDENLEDIKALDSLAKEARIAQRFLDKKEKEQKRISEKLEEEQRLSKDREIEDYINGVKSHIDETDEMAGFKLTPKIKKGFKEYLFKKDNQGLSEAQKAGKDPLRRIKLAFLDYMDYNKNDFEVKIKSDLAKNYAKKVSRFTSTSAQSKGVTIKHQDNNEGLQPGFTDFWSSEE